MRNRQISSKPVHGFFHRIFLGEKLNNGIGLLIVTSISILFAVTIANNFVLGLEVFAGFVGICVLLLCLLNPSAGLYIIMLYGFSASALSRFLFKDRLPVGVVIDVLIFTTFVGLFVSKLDLKQNSTRFFRARPVIWYSIIVLYLTFEFFNPIGHSFGGWVQVMRKVFESFLIVFISYNVFDSLSKVKTFIKFLFLCALVLGVYGCFQQWHGLLGAEISWVNADPLRFNLISIWGEYRKFSLLGGPTEFGIIMAACSVFFILIGINERGWVNRIAYIVGAGFMILGMSYSGTRTANAMVAGAMILFILLTIEKKSSRLFAVFALFAFLFVMYAPIYSSATLLRVRSTFSASEDASYNVREINRQSVQPFIWGHPVGSGLSTTGEMGQRYNPGNPNAGFPTDSSYLNKALESGWIGLLITCILYYFMLQYTIRGYFLSKKNEVKTLFAGSAAFFFSFFLGEITQEAVGVFSNMGVYFPLFAMVLRLRDFSRDDIDENSEG